MILPALSGPLVALIAALVWGSADFTGGQAARRLGQYPVLVLSAFSGALVLLTLALLRGEALPAGADLAYAAASGVCGALALGIFYRGLASGNTALVAPVAAVVGASAPLVFELLRSQPPTGLQSLGFALALLGIWLVTQTTADLHHLRRAGLVTGVSAGLGFGGFFIFIGIIRTEAVFAPLLISRSAMLLVALALVALRRETLPVPQRHPLALLAGVLDVGGNTFYMLATQLTRLDVAAVLSSLYPAVTVLWALGLNGEKLTRWQWLGLGACLGAVGLMVT
jgi:drug/metabolite transporter (DMT)-like permease